jgi:NAD(P)-dependent dehydrogenase (short-subunit alcohol dehydrogenase family)
MPNPVRPDGPAADPRHLLVIGAGPGLGGALAHRFAQGGYHLTLLAPRCMRATARPEADAIAPTSALAQRCGFSAETGRCYHSSAWPKVQARQGA